MKDILKYLKSWKYPLSLLFVMTTMSFFYINHLSDQFLEGMDDDWGIYENPLVQELSKENLYKIWTNDTRDMYYLPVTFTSFAIDVALFGNEAKSMKIENLLFFLLSGCLLYYLLSLLNIPPIVICCTVMLYLVHPMQIESIALPTGRRQVLNVFFLLISVIGLFKFLFENNSWRWWAVAIIGFALSVGSKPPSIVFFPFLMIVILAEYFIFKNIKLDFKRLASILLPMLLIVICCLYLNHQAGKRNFLQQDFHYNTFQHLLIIGSSFGIIFKKIFMGPYTIFAPIDSHLLFNYQHYIALSLLTIIILSFCFIGLLKRNRCLLYGILWYLFALIPSSLLLLFSSDFPMNTSDRYFMLASPGIFLVLVYFLYRLNKKISFVFIVLISIYFFNNSIRQIGYWKDSISLLEHSIELIPTKDMMYKLAISLYNKQRVEESSVIIYRSMDKDILEYFPTPNWVYVDLSLVLQSVGDLKGAKEFLYNSLNNNSEGINIERAKIDELFPLSKEKNLNYSRFELLKNEVIGQSSNLK